MSGPRHTLISAQHLTPLTRAQELLWAGQALAPDSAQYNMGWRFDLCFHVDAERFSTAFEHTAHTSDAMRMQIIERAGMAGFKITDDVHSLPDLIDLSGEDTPDVRAAEWINARLRHVFDLGQTTYETALLKLSDGHFVWFFNQHHIATDAMAAQLLVSRVSAAYDALERGDALPGDAPRFTDYAKAHADLLAQPITAKASTYWDEMAAQATAMTVPYNGSLDRTSCTSARHDAPVSPATWGALTDALTRPPLRMLNPDLSRFTALATVYAALLARVTGDETITIGAPSHNRHTPDARQTLGVFIELFPLQVTVEASDTFTTLHAKMQADVFRYLRHAKPGASNVAATSMFHAVLNYIPVEIDQFAGRAITADWLHPGAHDAGHDLRLHVHPFAGNNSLRAQFDVNDRIGAHASPTDIGAHFAALLTAFIEDPGASVFSAPLSTLAPGHTVSRGADTPLPAMLPSRVLAQAEATPDVPAIRMGQDIWRYGDLHAGANAIAQTLIENGAVPGDRILVHSQRGAEVLPAMIGVWRAGGVMVPVPRDCPKGRMSKIVEASSPRFALCDVSGARSLQDAAPSIPIVDISNAQMAENDHPLVWPSADDAAYILFTSGSTGAPKGVTVSHASLARYIDWAARTYLDPACKDMALFSSIGFDLTLTSIFAPLVCGGCVIVYPETAGLTDMAVLDVFEDDAVDVVKLTPSHLALICEADLPVARISRLILGGEALTRDLCERAKDHLGRDIRIFNEYGPTEATIGCMVHVYDAGRDTGANVPIGVAADDVALHLLDAGGNPVPTGITGEIHIGGPRVADGYFGRDDLTAERFVIRGGNRLYATGDLAFCDTGGKLHYLGRADTQLKLGGVRIEPAEVETALMALPGVSAVAVGVTGLASQAAPTDYCVQCGIEDTYPGADLNTDGVCAICTGFEAYRDKAAVYFETPDVLTDKVEDAAHRSTGTYDIIMLLSGGKDSTYALYRMHEMTPRILALTLDNGYISPEAMANIKRVTDHLKIDHRFLSTPAMNDIFVDSLKRHSNVCNGCFKTIYTLALDVAREEGVSAIVTGLSRGQFFETRLTPELFEGDGTSAHAIDDMVMTARRAYHATPDAVTRLIDAPHVESGAALDAVEFIDIYRYIDVPLTELYDFLDTNVPWQRPTDTGRSTNCLINDVGIYLHKRREGFHNYALPYSWDVRMGHKTADEAREELDDTIDPRRVQQILDEIGFDEDISADGEKELAAWIVTDGSMPVSDIRTALAAHLPAAMIPRHILPIEALALTANGKIDFDALPKPNRAARQVPRIFEPPQGKTETLIAQIWSEILDPDRVGALDNFYDIGGDSIAAIRIAAAARDMGLNLSATDVFEQQTVRALAAIAQQSDGDTTATPPAEKAPLVSLGASDLAALSKALKRD